MQSELCKTSSATIVVKLGGSLYDLPDLRERLSVFLNQLPQGRIVIVPGGGATADVVREWDRVHRLGEETAHWLALRSLTFNAYWLQEMLSGAIVSAVIEQDYLEDSNQEDRSRWVLLDAFRFAQGDEGRPGALPHIWDATSDSVAARVAVVVRATGLILLKSVTIPEEMEWNRVSEKGFVDPVFPNILQQVTWPMSVQAVNFRDWQLGQRNEFDRLSDELSAAKS